MSGNFLYPLLSTELVLVIIFLSYLRRATSDHFQRKVYFYALAFTFAAIAAHFAGTILEGRPNRTALTVIFNVFVILQQCSYYSIVIFLDYLINKNSTRTRQFVYISAGLMAVNIIILAVNYYRSFYFYISDTNYYADGSLFLVRFYMSYSAVLMIIIDILLSIRQFRTAQISLIALFALLSGAGAVLDILLPGGNLVWIFLTAAMLVAYFYIIQRDTTLDAITGIGNRSSLIEFVDQIVKANIRQSYTMVLFDIDNLKKINKDYGTSAGDRALAEMAALLKKCTRGYDFIARIGADEFLVAVKEQFNTHRLIERILNSLDELNKEPDRQYALSVNYGYIIYTAGNYQSIDEFLIELNERVYLNRNEKREDFDVRRRASVSGM